MSRETCIVWFVSCLMFFLLRFDNMNKKRVFVKRACQQALDAHETEAVAYFDALLTAERLYASNWKLYRQKKGLWGSRDEARARRFALPSNDARVMFDTDVEIQCLLASRDARLPLYRDTLQDILRRHMKDATSRPLFHAVLHDFLEVVDTETTGTRRRVWRAVFGDVTYVFPGRDVWALWLCLRDMWPKL